METEISVVPKIITLTTDFGPDSSYAGAMKGVIWSIAPHVQIADLSHSIPAQSITTAAFVLGTTYCYYPSNTIHVAVIDPGVGSERGAVAVQTDNYIFIAPDNGLLSLALENERIKEIVRLENREYMLPKHSCTFHGRDIFSPAAAYLALGIPITELGPTQESVITDAFPQPMVHSGKIKAQIFYADRFGNLITSISRELWDKLIGRKEFILNIGEKRITRLVEYYEQGFPGDIVALFGSSDYLEIACVLGDAGSTMGLNPDDLPEVEIIYNP